MSVYMFAFVFGFGFFVCCCCFYFVLINRVSASLRINHPPFLGSCLIYNCAYTIDLVRGNILVASRSSSQSQDKADKCSPFRKNQHVKGKSCLTNYYILEETEKHMMMQMLLSAGFPEKLLEKHSQIAFRNVF